MKNKKLLTRISVLLMTFVLSIAFMSDGITSIAKAYSSNANSTEHKIYGYGYDFSNSGLRKAYNPLTQELDDTAYQYKWANEFYYYTTSDGEYAYCLQAGFKHYDSVTQLQMSFEDIANNKVYNKYFNTTQQTWLKYTTVYGYKGTTHYGYTWQEELIATQALEWIIVGKYYDTTTSDLGYSENKFINCLKTPSTASLNNIKDIIKKMKANIISHKVIPAKTTAQDDRLHMAAVTYNVPYNSETGKYQTEIKLDNTLSQFEVNSIDGVSLNYKDSDGNGKADTIVISSDSAEAVNGKIVTLNKTKSLQGFAIDQCVPLILLASTSNPTQMKISYHHANDPIQAFFALRAASGKVEITKTFTDINDNDAEPSEEMLKATKFKLQYTSNDGNVYYIKTDSEYAFEKTTANVNEATVFNLDNNAKIKISGLIEGKYKLIETEAAAGYSKSNVEFTVSANDTTQVIAKNKAWSVKFSINKTDVSTGELIPDCEFEILNQNKEQIMTGVTDENGIAEFTLGYGNYYYREISAPEQYVIDDTPYAFSITKEGTAVKADMTNRKKKGSIEITKTDISTGNVIQNCGIEILNEKLEVVKSGHTDENGIVIFKDLTYGKYYFREFDAPNGYLLNTDLHEFEITEDGAILHDTLSDVRQTGSIKVTKKTEGNLNIAGIKFRLFGTADIGEDINFEAVTDETGTAVFANIPIGTYSVKEDESSVVAAYLVADEQEVTVYNAETTNVEFCNAEKTGSIQVKKRTEGDHNISNIDFILSGTSDSGREINITATTDENGIAAFENIPIGTYAITEDGSTTPYGYLVAEPQEVTVMYAETTNIEVLNNEKAGSIKVHKTTEGNYNISGIDFVLSGTSDTGREINITATTDENGIAEFNGIPVGTYTIAEQGKTVPYGYLVADEQQVTVMYAQTVDVTVLNKEMTGEITLTKRTEGNFNVSGIDFKLSGTSDAGRPIEITATTDKDGIAKFENIPIGTYEVTEDGDTVPYGYLVAEPQKVTVMYSKTIDVTCLNNEKTGSIEVHKTTKGMTDISNIKFILKGTSDTGREINLNAITDKNGIATFTNIPVGTYEIYEDGSSVPTGYLVADSQNVTVMYAQTTTVNVKNEKIPTTPETPSQPSQPDTGIKIVFSAVPIALLGVCFAMSVRKKKDD